MKAPPHCWPHRTGTGPWHTPGYQITVTMDAVWHRPLCLHPRAHIAPGSGAACREPHAAPEACRPRPCCMRPEQLAGLPQRQRPTARGPSSPCMKGRVMNEMEQDMIVVGASCGTCDSHEPLPRVFLDVPPMEVHLRGMVSWSKGSHRSSLCPRGAGRLRTCLGPGGLTCQPSRSSRGHRPPTPGPSSGLCGPMFFPATLTRATPCMTLRA